MSGFRPGLASWLVPAVIFFSALFATVATSPHYGVVWDEPYYFHAADLHVDWLGALAKNVAAGRISESLKDEAIVAAWRWDPYHVPHPPFSRVVSGATKTLLAPFVDSFAAYRVAPALFFAGLVLLMYLWMARVFDRLTGLFSAFALLLIPNLFGFAHFAVTDMPLAFMWFFTAYSFWRGLESWRWSLAAGAVWGLALSTKFPALLIPVPLLLWAHLYHRRSYGNNLISMMLLGPLVMIATQPYLWHQTSLRVLEFLYEGVSRGYRPDANFAVFFFNRLYSTADLPWYYAFFTIAVTTPEFILALCLLSAAAFWRLRAKRDLMALFWLNALFVPLLGTLPGAVLHDGVRQLLSALPFIAGLAGAGFYWLLQITIGGAQKVAALGKITNLRPKIAATGFALLLLPPAWDLFLYHPYELSYYNRLAGGTRGAFEKGLEVTYFMEAFTPEFLQFLNEKLPPGATLNASFANFMFAYYQKENRLRPDIRIVGDKEPSDYSILLTRRSVWSLKDIILFRNNLPIAAVRLGEVPLVSLYSGTASN